MKSVTNANKTNIEITSGQSCVKFNTREQTTEVMGLKSSVNGPSAEWEWNLKEDKTNKVQTISEHSSETQYPSAKCVYEAFQDIPEFVQKQSDWDEADNTKVAYIKNKPTIPVVPTDVSAFNNDAGYITMSQVPAQVQSDWSQSDNQAVDYIKNKPTIPAAQVNSDWNAVSGVSQILNKPTIPVVPTDVSAFTNDAGYITLSDVPAQVQSDWNQTDNQAVDFIKNKPTIPTALPVLIKYVQVNVTDYTIPSESVGTMYAISIADGIGTVTIHATSGTWLHWKLDGCENFYPATGSTPERTASMTDAGGGSRTLNLFIRMH